ncbi:MAG: hypothetical protein JXP34_14195 [Planctomycetes bacterium]|nr:hypothetical protein [Planctomycetota bacterium]
MDRIQCFRIVLVVCISVSLVVAAPGCSFFVPFTQTITVTASEPDAQIVVNGAFVGSGTVQTRARRNTDVAVLVTKQGFRPTTRSIGHSMGAAGILDIIGGCVWLIPFLGLLSPGAWKLDETNMVILLAPEQPQTAAPIGR